jgi:hypothetical protein
MTTRSLLLKECSFCDGARMIRGRHNKLKNCPVCDGDGVTPVYSDDVTGPVDRITDALTSVLKRKSTTNIIDVLADEHSRLVDLILGWKP